MGTGIRRRSLFLVVLCCASVAAAPVPEEHSRFLTRYRQMVILYAQDAIDKSARLSRCIDRFLDAPTDTVLSDCRSAWLESHEAYLKGRLFATLPASRSDQDALAKFEFNVDAWPIEEGYLDGLEEYPTSGIVNDLTVTIDEASLRRQHGLTDRSEVATGFHPLEFLLWRKPVDEFLPSTTITAEQRADGMTPADLPSNRRRALLQLLARLLASDVAREFGAFAAPGQPGEYAEPTDGTLMRGCSAAWRRLRRELAQYAAGGKENLHSRFSDSSARDLLSEADAIASLLIVPGRLLEQLAPLDPLLGERYTEEIAAALDALRKLEGTPAHAAAAEFAMATIDPLIETSTAFEQKGHVR